MDDDFACYNIAMDGGDVEDDEDDPWDHDIADTEGEREFQGP